MDADIEALAAAMPDEAIVEEPKHHKHHPHHQQSSGELDRPGNSYGSRGGGGGGEDGGGDGESSAGGDTRDEDAQSAVSATNSQADEMLVDSRRGRVVKVGTV